MQFECRKPWGHSATVLCVDQPTRKVRLEVVFVHVVNKRVVQAVHQTQIGFLEEQHLQLHVIAPSRVLQSESNMQWSMQATSRLYSAVSTAHDHQPNKIRVEFASVLCPSIIIRITRHGENIVERRRAVPILGIAVCTSSDQ